MVGDFQGLGRTERGRRKNGEGTAWHMAAPHAPLVGRLKGPEIGQWIFYAARNSPVNNCHIHVRVPFGRKSSFTSMSLVFWSTHPSTEVLFRSKELSCMVPGSSSTASHSWQLARLNRSVSISQSFLFLRSSRSSEFRFEGMKPHVVATQHLQRSVPE